MICLSLSLPSTLSLSIMWRKQKTKETAYSKSPYESFPPLLLFLSSPPAQYVCTVSYHTTTERERMCVCVWKKKKARTISITYRPGSNSSFSFLPTRKFLFFARISFLFSQQTIFVVVVVVVFFICSLPTQVMGTGLRRTRFLIR